MSELKLTPKKAAKSQPASEQRNIRVIATTPKVVIPVEVDGVLYECATLPAVKANILAPVITSFAPAIEAVTRNGSGSLGDSETMGTAMRVALPLFYEHAGDFAKFVAACTNKPEAEIAELGADALSALTDVCLEANEAIFFAPMLRILIGAVAGVSGSMTFLNSSDTNDTTSPTSAK